MAMAPKLRRTRAMRDADMTDAEFTLLKNVTPAFKAARIRFDCGDEFKAMQAISSNVLSKANFSRKSTTFLVIELARTFLRITNNLDGHDKRDPEYSFLVDPERLNLSTELLWAKMLNPLAYLYDDIFKPGHAPYATGGGFGGGEFRPGYDDTDVKLRMLRLHALIEERDPENNMTQAEMHELKSRVYPTIDNDDPRFWKFCCE